MEIPGFIGKDGRRRLDANGKRVLVGLEEIDVARDIVDIKFVQKGDEEEGKEQKYFLQLTNWTSNNIEIFVNFTDPLAISNGINNDAMIVNFKNPSLFVSKSSGEVLPKAKAMLTSEFPR